MQKRDSGANSDVSDTSMFTFMVADRKRSANETGATSEEDWDRPHFDSDTGEEQGMAGRGRNDPAAQARSNEPAEASYESSAPTPVPVTPDQAVSSSFRTLEEPTGERFLSLLDVVTDSLMHGPLCPFFIPVQCTIFLVICLN